MAVLRSVGDEPADSVRLRPRQRQQQQQQQQQQRQQHRAHRALLDPLAELEAAAASASSSPELRAAAGALLRELNVAPAWVDFGAVRRGQAFFVRHLSLASLSLLHVGLVGGFGAPLIHPVLEATGYLTSTGEHPRRTHRRVFETLRFVNDCLGEPLADPPLTTDQQQPNSKSGSTKCPYSSGAFPSTTTATTTSKNGKGGGGKKNEEDDDNDEEGDHDRRRSGLDVGGKGWRACIKVRLLHAAVRRRLLTRHEGSEEEEGEEEEEEEEPSDSSSDSSASASSSSSSGGSSSDSPWPTTRLGVPICQADLTATQLAFSCCVLLGMANCGVGFTRQEASDVLHWWRLVGHL